MLTGLQETVTVHVPGTPTLAAAFTQEPLDGATSTATQVTVCFLDAPSKELAVFAPQGLPAGTAVSGTVTLLYEGLGAAAPFAWSTAARPDAWVTRDADSVTYQVLTVGTYPPRGWTLIVCKKREGG